MYGAMGLLAGGLGFVLFIIYVLGNSIFAAWLASKKGYSGFAWFVLGLLFGFFAFLAIGFAPDERNNQIASTLENIKRNLFDANNSHNNNNPINQSIINNSKDCWFCKKCGTKNLLTSNSCKDCGAYK